MINSQLFLVQRTCTRKSENQEEQGGFSIESFRNLPAYVLLGDPGSGKTSAFKQEAQETGGQYVTSRDFVTFDPEEHKDKILFIDALDEMRTNSADGRGPLDQIRKNLQIIGNPVFRLSCREADWLGESDKSALMRVSPNGKIATLHLDPLTNKDVIEILSHKKNISNPADFIQKSRENGLEELLHNPQTLNLLVKAVGENKWPSSRSETFEMACYQLVREENTEHRAAKHNKTPNHDKLLDAAGYLCAICLLSGKAGVALEVEAADEQHFDWKELAIGDFPLLEALKTNLFQSESEVCRLPIHRSVAEYLGARYLSTLINDHGLPLARLLALVTGEDGGIVTDLRGLMAWLSTQCYSARFELIKRDPLGVVLYGDVLNFSIDDKLLVLESLKKEAQRYPWFRSDDWTSHPFGAIGTKGMESRLLNILQSSSRKEEDQALLDCVLDAIRHGESMLILNDPLETIIRDSSYWPIIRKNALRTFFKTKSNDNSKLLKLVDDINQGNVEDNDDELLGDLLRELYPDSIRPDQIFDYLHPLKNDHLFGNYFAFWHHRLPSQTPNSNLLEILDQLVQRHKNLSKMLLKHQLKAMVGELLTLGLETFGDKITDAQLYDWLGVGLDEHQFTILLEDQHIKRITNWFAERPDRYKAIIEHGAYLSATKEVIRYRMRQSVTRLYDSSTPIGIENWYLEKAQATQQNELAEYFFQQAIYILLREDQQDYLSLTKLEFIECWVTENPRFQQWLEPFITCSLDDYRRDQYLRKKEDDDEQQQEINKRLHFYRKHLVAIGNGSADPNILHNLAAAYFGRSYESRGETPYECLMNFLNSDEELISAAYSGFQHVLDRNDLPTINEIVDLTLQEKIHWFHLPCLAGINEFYLKKSSDALKLDDEILSRLIAFHFTLSMGDSPAWMEALIQKRPELVAEILIACATPLLHAGKEHVSGLYPLAENDKYESVAKIAIPKLLEIFPLRSKKLQLRNILGPSLKAAIHYIDQNKLTSIIKCKPESEDIDIAQRVYWLACGLAIEPSVYTEKLNQCLTTSKARCRFLVEFLNCDGNRSFPYQSLPENTLSILIKLLAPYCSPDRPGNEGWVTSEMRTADLVRTFINILSGKPSKISRIELEGLIDLSNLTHWHNPLKHALYTQQIVRRKSNFHRLNIKEIKNTLANLQPANAADLSALTYDYLCDIAKNIRDSSTNDYKLYWNYDVQYKKIKNVKPKPEDDCRDVLLTTLKEKLGKLRIDAIREGSYADDKRADIRVSYNGFNIPIEIKKDSHEDLWNAIHTQLIPKYTRDPGAEGYGIYLVFWFGNNQIKALYGKKPDSPTELLKMLNQTLKPDEEHRIKICVIDCALP